MTVEIDELTRNVVRDDSIRAVVFMGQGDMFTHFQIESILDGLSTVPFTLPYPLARAVVALTSAFGRIRVLDRIMRDSPLRGAAMQARIYATLNPMTASDAAFISAINGTALAFGFVLALSCDVRLAAEGDYLIGFPEVGAGVVAGATGSQQLARIIGPSRAMDYLLVGRLVGPSEALKEGLIHELVSPDSLRREALKVAQRLASRPAHVVRGIKRVTHQATRLPTPRAFTWNQLVSSPL